MKKIIVLTGILFVSLFNSCNKEEALDNKVPVCDYDQFSMVLGNDLDHIARNVRDLGFNFTDPKAVMKSAADYYCESSEQYMKFSLAFDDSYQKGLSSSEFSPFQKEIAQEIETALLGSLDFNEFYSFLDSKLETLSADGFVTEETNEMLLYIASVRTSIEFVYDNKDLFPVDDLLVKGDPEDEENWWNRWGRCAAAIAGGAISGAGGGILGGAAVGTVVLPVVGTVSGAVVGGIVLGIGGGLTGAAAGC